MFLKMLKIYRLRQIQRLCTVYYGTESVQKMCTHVTRGTSANALVYYRTIINCTVPARRTYTLYIIIFSPKFI